MKEVFTRWYQRYLSEEGAGIAAGAPCDWLLS